MSVSADSKKAFIQFLGALSFVLVTGCAHAIGDSGGCATNRDLVDTLSSGPAAALSSHVAAQVERAWQALEPGMRTVLSSTPRALLEWQAQAKKALLNGHGAGCGEGVLLDRAIEGGNLEVAQWLLHQGADPNGTNPHLGTTVFDRCPATSMRPGIDAAQAAARTAALYRMLIARGADRNRVREELNFVAGNALTSCTQPHMLQLLLDLGVDRSPQRGDVPLLHAPLQTAVWDALSDPVNLPRVRVLAQGGFNDLRGTRIEARLYESCRIPARAQNCRLLEPLVRVNPGIWPTSAPHAPAPQLPGTFSAHRETCHFPELRFVGDMELAVVSQAGGLATGTAFQGAGEEARQVEIIVNSPTRPALLLLQARSSRIWSVRRTPGTQILGVVIQKGPDLSAHQTVLGLAPETPRVRARCDAPITDEGQAPQYLLQRRSTSPDSLDPFERGLPFKVYTAASGPVVVGEPVTVEARAALPPLPILHAHVVGLEVFPRAPPAPLRGRAALEAMVADGRLMRADASNFIYWMGAVRQRPWWRNGLPAKAPAFWEAYANSSPVLRLPEGLRGPDAPIIFTPADTKIVGEVGDTTFFFSNNGERPDDPKAPRFGSCVGPRC